MTYNTISFVSQLIRKRFSLRRNLLDLIGHVCSVNMWFSFYYPNVTMLRSGLCCRNSVCRLSVCRLSVCNVGAPYSGVEPFGKISSPLYTLAII